MNTAKVASKVAEDGSAENGAPPTPWILELDGDGGMRVLDAVPGPGERTLWIHLGPDEASDAILAGFTDLPDGVVQALTAMIVRARAHEVESGILINLHGINLNPGSEPEDLVTLRVFVRDEVVLSRSRFGIKSVREVHAALAAGKGPCDTGGLIASLANRLFRRLGALVDEIDDEVDEIEQRMLDPDSDDPETEELFSVRLRCLGLRRHLLPQREAVRSLLKDPPEWLDGRPLALFRESSEVLLHALEDLAESQQHASLVQEAVENRARIGLDRKAYLMSLLASIFLPLTLISGMLGMNVGGIPLGDQPNGFVWITGALGIFGLLFLLLFKRWKWL
ncbi:MAG: CorA family divalent cation transporter [Planctomycetota bacterium]